MARRTKADIQAADKAMNEMVRKMFAERGGVLCKACSLGNWDIYHTPGNPCPKPTKENP